MSSFLYVNNRYATITPPTSMKERDMTRYPTELAGLLAFPLTPFTDQLELDLDVLGDQVEAHVDAGAGALFVACGTGEFSSLAPHEVRAVLRRTRDVVAGRVPVLVGAGGGPEHAQHLPPWERPLVCRDPGLAARERGRRPPPPASAPG